MILFIYLPRLLTQGKLIGNLKTINAKAHLAVMWNYEFEKCALNANIDNDKYIFFKKAIANIIWNIKHKLIIFNKKSVE